MLPNQARSREGLISGGGQAGLPMGSVIGEWLPPWNGRRTWVLSHRMMVLGVVSAHRRPCPGHWEVDRVHVARGKEESWTELLQALNPALARLGADRLFLRLPAESPLKGAAIEAGFNPYIREELYLRPKGGQPADSLAQAGSLLSPGEADQFHLFRLYNCAVPAPVRETEGMTFQDWSRSRDTPRGWRREEELVVGNHGDICAWLSLSGRADAGIIDLLVNPQERDGAGALVDGVVRRRGHQDKLLCLLPHYQQFLCGHLQENGFQKTGDFSLYVRHVTARLRETGLLPVGA